jgi:hypothetical protein
MKRRLRHGMFLLVVLASAWALTARGQMSDPALAYAVNTFATNTSSISGFGVTEVLAVTPCFANCLGSTAMTSTVSSSDSTALEVTCAPPNGAWICLNTGAPGAPLSNGPLSVGGSGSAVAEAQLAGSNASGGPSTYQLTNLTASASETGLTGAAAVAIIGAWDTLTFYGGSSGATGTVNMTVSLAAATGFTDVGLGGGCISLGTACTPFSIVLSSTTSTSVTLSQVVPLGQAVTIFDAIGVVAANDFNLQTATIDPALTITLPPGVAFTSASGNSGGVVPVPEPATLPLMAVGLVAFALRHRCAAQRTGSSSNDLKRG